MSKTVSTLFAFICLITAAHANNGASVGGSIVGFIILCLIIWGCWRCCCRPNKTNVTVVTAGGGGGATQNNFVVNMPVPQPVMQQQQYAPMPQQYVPQNLPPQYVQ